MPSHGDSKIVKSDNDLKEIGREICMYALGKTSNNEAIVTTSVLFHAIKILLEAGKKHMSSNDINNLYEYAKMQIRTIFYSEI